MKLTPHTASDYADALQSLLPPGDAWQWPKGGFGDALLTATAQELARVDAATQDVLDSAIEQHTPGDSNWHISGYRAVAAKALAGVAETLPRKTAAIGCTIGTRLWSSAAPETTFEVPLFRIDHLLGPARIGSRIGDGLWTAQGRKVLRVRYYRSVVNPQALWDAIAAFKQADVYLYFQDITGIAGEVSYAQN